VDLGKARQLLKASGYDGRAIKIITSRRDPQMFDTAVVIQAMAAQAGIRLQIDTLDWPAHLARYTTGDYQMMVESFSARLDPTLSFGLFIGDKHREPRTADPTLRQSIFDQLSRDFLEEVPAVVLFNSARLSVVRAVVTGHQNWMSAQPRLWGVGLR
jgi:peptide/nickel transport system substrate-binding protein